MCGSFRSQRPAKNFLGTELTNPSCYSWDFSQGAVNFCYCYSSRKYALCQQPKTHIYDYFQREVLFLTLTERIKTLAEPNGLTFAEIERRAALGRGTIRKWDTNIPSADKLLRVANLLDTSMEYLLIGDEQAGGYGICKEDRDFLNLLHKLPKESKIEIRGIMKGFLLANGITGDELLDGTSAK